MMNTGYFNIILKVMKNMIIWANPKIICNAMTANKLLVSCTCFYSINKYKHSFHTIEHLTMQIYTHFR